MFSLIILAERTCELGFSQIVNQSYTAQSTTATQRGAKKYMLCGIKDSMKPISNIVIPDLKFELNAGITKIDVALTDIKLANLNVQDVAFNLFENRSQIAVLNCSVLINFQWSFQQQSYPYVVDKGSGKIIVNNGELKGDAGSEVDPECPGHLKVSISGAQISYESVNIVIDGGDTWLFQSIINIFQAIVEDELAKSLSKVLLEAFVKLLNNVFEDGRRFLDYTNHYNIIKDERYTTGIQAKDGAISLLFTGYVYARGNLTDDYVTPQMLNKVTYNKFNNDMQISIHESAINNAFYTFHKYENVYSSATYQVSQAPKITFYNAAAILEMQVKVNNSLVDLELIAHLQHENNLQEQRAYVFFTFQKYSAQTADESIDISYIEDDVVNHMNSVIKFACYQLSYTHLTELNDYTHMFDPVERVIRLVGPEEYECKGAR
ncbi:Conserved_hypothetical protein [Hexamita inflata]|uniref:Lipid-binding serum glycoprotein N-terminal domain-containing protein n=1 Tax=Hexamita inflata TaxID=28002 RepID=A0AA86U7Q0_9EUKA|nr:Conserved hypothetical protein [Hexamita inflata]